MSGLNTPNYNNNSNIPNRGPPRSPLSPKMRSQSKTSQRRLSSGNGNGAGSGHITFSNPNAHPYNYYEDSDVESINLIGPPGSSSSYTRPSMLENFHHNSISHNNNNVIINNNNNLSSSISGVPNSSSSLQFSNSNNINIHNQNYNSINSNNTNNASNLDPHSYIASTTTTTTTTPHGFNNFTLGPSATLPTTTGYPNGIHNLNPNLSSTTGGLPSSSHSTGNPNFRTPLKRPPYIRQISGFSESTIPNSPIIYPFSPVIRATTPSSTQDDPSLTLLPQRGKLKPKMKSYWAYYIPALEWIPRYKRKYLFGDIAAGLTIASFQIPISMSYAASLAHVPMVCGLYGLVIPPFVYGLMGSTPYMVVGPEAALSLVVGQAVSPYLHSDLNIPIAQISGIMAGSSGAVLLCAGLLRFGFLDSVLSRALLRGFISAVGIVMVIDQLSPELGIEELLHTTIGTHATTWEKILFLCKHASAAHRLTATVAFTAMFVIISFRVFKARLSNVFKKIIFVPEILIVVIMSTILTAIFRWDQESLKVVGNIKPGSVNVQFPITPKSWPIFKDTFSASFVCAVLGFFESTIASKSLGATTNSSVSTNRELVALGVTNLLGSLVNTLPSFGGYGRSKINMLSGARTNLASFVLSFVTVLCIAFAMPYFYYLPKCVLSSVISVVGLSLIEEAPKDIMFYWRIGGYEDLFTMYLTLICTIFWSVETGIALGVGFSLVRVIRHATRSRIQILGRLPGTSQFENADVRTPDRLEEIDGCLIVKIPEPLTFANTGDLRNRLRRLEVYGSMRVHPSFPRIRQEEMTRYVIFDLHGMTECDSSAIQILLEIVSSYVVDRGIPVLLARVPANKNTKRMFELAGVDDLVTKPSKDCYFTTIEDALRYIDDKGQIRNSIISVSRAA